MAKILYNFDTISTSLNSLNGSLELINALESSISSLSVDVPELSGALNSAKQTTIENINNITEILTDNIKKVQNLCEAYQEYESSKSSNDSLLNKEFPIKEVVSSTNYDIKYGDTLTSIAKKQNVTVDAIVEANKDKITDENLIYAGDTIVIPKSNKVTSEEVKQKDVTKGNSVISEEIETFTLKEKQQTSGLISDSNLTDKKNEEVNNYKNTNIQINYRTSTIDGNSVVAGNSGYTINEVMTKIKESCEKNNIGEHWVDVAAISLWETGTYSSAAFTKNNPGGLSYADGSTRYSFNTLDEGIDAFVSNLSKNYYGEGRTTLSSISTKYCPGTADNWVKNVNTMKKQIERCL